MFEAEDEVSKSLDGGALVSSDISFLLRGLFRPP